MIDFIRTLLRNVKPGDTILDVGANVGGYTQSFRGDCPEAIIHAFEPFPKMFRRLSRKCQNDPKTHCWNLGVGAVCEEVKGVAIHEAWTINKPGETNKSRNASHGDALFDMRVITLDAFLFDHPQAGPISALKIDTDGYDFRVLRGAEFLIERHRPRILIEFGYCIVDLDGLEAVGDMIQWIRDRRYAIYNEHGTLCVGPPVDWYPFHTTADFLLIPQEQELIPA